MVTTAFSDNVTIFANGDIPDDDLTQKSLKVALANGIKLEHRRVKKLIDNGLGEDGGISVELDDGEVIKLGCIFHHAHVKSLGDDIIQQLGVETTPIDHRLGLGGDVAVQTFNKTNIPGVFAAGDTSGLHKSVPIAMSGGNLAGVAVCQELMAEEAAKLLEGTSG